MASEGALELPDWEKITPQAVLSVVRHIRDDVAKQTFWISSHTSERCSTKLHKPLPPSSPESLVFRQEFEAYVLAMQKVMLDAFERFLRISPTNVTGREGGQVEWAKLQTLSLIEREILMADSWVKESCDVQPFDPEDNTNDEFIWSEWRAPSFLRMRPNGNTPYDTATAWTREGEAFTMHVLGVHREDRLRTSLTSALDKAVGAQYEAFAGIGAAIPRQAHSGPPSEETEGGVPGKPVESTLLEASASEKLASPTKYPTITRREVEAALQRSRSTVYRLAEEGKIVKLPNGRYRTTSVAAYLNSED